MASSNVKTVPEYLASLPPARRKVVSAARALVRRHLPKGYKESMMWGMITWAIPLSAYPNTYNKQPLCYAALAAQKNYSTLYLMSASGSDKLHDGLKKAFAKAGKKLDMGQSCLHFNSMDDLVPEAIANVIASTTPAQYIKHYEQSRKRM
jgi:hypothetical protein